MKKLLTSLLVLGSTVAVAACAANGNSAPDLDGDMNAPYAEERTVGATQAPAPVVRSAAPVFQSTQVK